MANHTYFSTGVIKYGAVGGPLTGIAAVQNVTFTTTFQTQEVREAAFINKYPVANAQLDAETMIEFECTAFDPDIIPFITGAVKTSAGGYDVYTGTATGGPQEMQLQFIGQDTTGKIIEITLPVSKIMSLPIGFKRDGYVSPELTAKSYPHAGASDGTEIPFKIRQQQ